MALEKYFPFRSVAGDRKYSAEDWAAYFAQFLSDGVFYNNANNLKVVANDAMKVTVNTGAGFVVGRMYVLEREKVLTIETADGVVDRIDRIVLRCDYINRLMGVDVIKGNYSATPTAPELTRNADVYELALADVYVAAGAIEITNANITDQRLNTSLCGIVTGLVEQADTTEIFNQFQVYLEEFKETSQADFDYWFNNVKAVLDEDATGNLLAKINTKAAQTDLEKEIATRQAEIEVERARINNLTKMEEGSTTGDAELQDARVGADGTIYETAGEAVRRQVKILTEEDEELEKELDYLNKKPNIVMELGYYDEEGKIKSFSQYSHSNLIKCKKGTTLSISGQDGTTVESAAVAIAFFDAAKNFIGSLKGSNQTVVIEDENIKYFALSNNTLEPPTVTLVYETRIDTVEKDIQRLGKKNDDLNTNMEILDDRIENVTGKVTYIPGEEVPTETVYDCAYISETGLIVYNGTMNKFHVKSYAVKSQITYIIQGTGKISGDYPIASFGVVNERGAMTEVLLQGHDKDVDYNLEYTPTENGYIFIAYVDGKREPLPVYKGLEQTEFEKWKKGINDSIKGINDSIKSYFSDKVIYTLGDSITYLPNSWAFQLAEKLEAKKVINIGRGGAKWADRGSAQIDYDVESPLFSLDIVATVSDDGKTVSFDGNKNLLNGNLPTDNMNYTTISNEIRFMQRLVTEGYEIPDIIIIACGINDTRENMLEFSEDNFNSIFETAFEEVTVTERSNIGGGLRWCIEQLRTLYPNAQIIVSTPIQSAYAYLRPYIPNTCNWIKTMCDYYSIHVINAFAECGISKVFEKGWEDMSYVSSNEGRHLYDGLHPNENGKKLMGNYFAKELKKNCYDVF